MQLSLKQKAFSDILFHFWNLNQILNILKKKVIVIVTFFRKLPTVKDMFRPLSKKHRFRTPFQGLKFFQNRHESTFMTFFHHSESI